MKYFDKELKMFKDYLYSEVSQIEDKTKCDLAITCLEVASKRFLTTIISSVIAILLFALVDGIKTGMSSAIVLAAIPYFIARVESSCNSLIDAPFRKITEVTNFRNIYANSVWITGVGAVLVSSILHV